MIQLDKQGKLRSSRGESKEIRANYTITNLS